MTTTDHPQSEPLSPPTLETLSPSRASDFKVCPQLFKFKAIDKIEVPPTIYQCTSSAAVAVRSPGS